MTEQIGRPGKTTDKFTQRRSLMKPERTHDITILVIPFEPAEGEIAQLVTLRPHIPRLGNQFHVGQDRIFGDRSEKAGIDGILNLIPCKNGCQIETETIDMELLNPIPQRIHYHLQNTGMTQIQAIAAA